MRKYHKAPSPPSKSQSHPSALELVQIREILRLYSKALIGRDTQILSSCELAERGIGWGLRDSATTDGSTIFLPSGIQDFDTDRENFEVYKVLTTHQAGHLELGSFEFSFSADAAIFVSLRPALSQILRQGTGTITDFERFFDLFSDRRLAHDLFTLSEDHRVDCRLIKEYRGIGEVYQRISQRELSRRQSTASLLLRDSLLELLIRISLGDKNSVALPAVHHERIKTALGLLRLIERPDATVEDSAEATIRLYALFAQVPNTGHFADSESRLFDPKQEMQIPNDDPLDWISEFLAANCAIAQLTPEDKEYFRYLPEVDFRGEFKPELVQTLRRLRGQDTGQGIDVNVISISAESLREMAGKSTEILVDWISGEDLAYLGDAFIANLLKEQAAALDAVAKSVESQTGSLRDGKSEAFRYDEWDFRERIYQPEWCQVWERVLREGSTKFYAKTLKAYPGLVSGIKKQFEMLRPERLKKVKRLQDGEEFDLDSTVEALVEKRAGHPPNDKVYWRHNKAERSVAVALLLDMSISTEERIKQSASDPVKIGSKRIIDIEKESLVLLIEALEQIGDAYGIYGFSGSGRDDIQFYIIKDLHEALSEPIKRRIDTMEPVQGTRMGAAIRHAVSKLEAEEARVRVLILLSDGRPQDRDYGMEPLSAEQSLSLFAGPRAHFVAEAISDGGEKEYAVHDTKMALLEARRKNIVPFCLSVDREGHDYLRLMCGDIGYEVVRDIRSLPRQLPLSYRRLTT